MFKTFPHYQQHDASDCGAACLRMIARHYGRFFSLEYLRELTGQRREGVSLLDISEGAERLGFKTLGASISLSRLLEEAPLPCIAFWRQNHYLVVYRTSRRHVWVADPSGGLIQYTHEQFLDGWQTGTENGEPQGVVLLLEPTVDFYQREEQTISKGGFQYVLHYLTRYRRLIAQLILGFVITILLQLAFPFLMQALVDEGISRQDFNFALLVLLAWAVLFGSMVLVEHLRSWIFLHLGIRANLNLISDFLIKVMRLPVRFFDEKLTSDLLKRVQDNVRVERLLTSTSLQAIFSSFSILLLGLVLLYYDRLIFVIFLAGTALYLLWILRFMRARREWDYIRFDQSAENQEKIMELINGAQEIKLFNAETQKRWEWERSEARLFRASMKYLSVNQRQRLGATLLNEGKNILITVFAAKAVIEGQLSLGGLLAVQYIIGQINTPLHQLVDFIRAVQDARISLERMNEVHLKDNEENPEEKISILPDRAGIRLENVTFHYPGFADNPVLKGLDFTIPHGKITAIVGSSGSGKTTLIKLLLNMYTPTEGAIRVGDVSLANVQQKLWRSRCGAVLQEGYLFSDSIARNIGLGSEFIEERKLLQAARVANILPFIESLPLGFGTRIGVEGMGLSQGQKQRILIARSVYKDPEYFFFDEATNALDAYNEVVIMENLAEHFAGRTIVVVAHRLSTVIHADHIIVLEGGEIVEQGDHETLSRAKGAYYHLLKNQLEFGG
jgi:ATP-binding cassette subfamily B protein